MHAEANAIVWAARYGIKLEGSEIHITNLPCLNCARLVVNAGITRVVYDEDYRIHDALRLFREASLRVDRFDMMEA